MSPADDTPEAENNPLAGVLDRLLARERGRPEGKAPDRPVPGPVPRTRSFAPEARRMIPVAALGSDRGDRALRVIARAALGAGRRPAVLDLACVEPPRAAEPQPGCAPETADSVAMAAIPCGPERLRGESPEVVAALLNRVRRHENGTDLLVVRVPPASRMALMQAAFLAGAVVLPLEDSEDVAAEAFRIAREVRDNFLDIKVVPMARSRASMNRYLALTRDFLGDESAGIAADGTGLESLLDRLSPPPGEGFTTALLAPGAVAPPPELFHLGSLSL